MELLMQPEVWLSFLTLSVLEIVLGIDNIIFITILVGHLPAAQRDRARLLGLALAMATRIVLLLGITALMALTAPLLTVTGIAFSGRDLILFAGGAFLLGKSTLEIHESLEGGEAALSDQPPRAVPSFHGVILQILVVDAVFSLDSVLTAVGLARHVPVMIAAIVAAVIVMMFAAAAIGRVVDTHPTLKMLALSFLILIGVALIADGLHVHVPRGYIYFAMAFAAVVELLNIRVRKRVPQPVRLRRRMGGKRIVAGRGSPPPATP